MMRKLLVLVAVGISAAASAQISLDRGSETVNLSPQDFDKTFSIVVSNTSDAESASVDVVREELNIVDGTSNYFCFGEYCYPAATSESAPDDPVIIPAGASDATFKAYYEPRNNPGNSDIQYCFSNRNALGDEHCLTITFAAAQGGTSIGEYANKTTVSANYSAANQQLTLVYKNLQVEGNVVVRDITGKLIATAKAPKGTGVVLVPATELNNGIHLISLNDLSGNPLAVTKLSVY